VTTLVAVVLRVEAAVLVTALLFVFGYAAAARSSEARRAARLAPVRAALLERLDDLDASPLLRHRLNQLPIPDLLRLFSDIAPNLEGAERAWLRQRAEETQLIPWARENAVSPAWWERLSAARLFRDLDAEPSTMRRMLSDREPLVRAVAAGHVALRPDDDGLARLIIMLSDEATFCRYTARDILMRLGATASPVVRASLDDPRHAAIIPLLDVAPIIADHDYLRPMLVLRADPRVAVRLRVVRVLRSIGGPYAAAVLLPMLDDPEPPVREATAEALGFLTHWPAAPAVARRLDDSVSRVRLAAACALDRFGAPGELFLRNAVRTGSALAATAARRILEDPARVPLGALSA